MSGEMRASPGGTGDGDLAAAVEVDDADSV